jgi:nanoRNase/pAp phosphatase (c-di-AMP/oligoRNAs hydrolase)
MNIEKNAETALKKIKNAESFLIVSSKPVDNDCLGTALAIDWWLRKLGKSGIKIVNFNPKTNIADEFPGSEKIDFIDISEVDFAKFEVIIVEDGNSWHQFLTNKAKRILKEINLENIIHIDHHIPGEIEEDLPETSVSTKDCCTAKVFYDYLLMPSEVEIDQEVADYMYRALVGDTGQFQFGLYTGTMNFAEKLIEAGADYEDAAQFTIPKEHIEFTAWAIQNTEYYPHAKLTILAIDENKAEQLESMFGSDWAERDLSRYYKNVVARKVTGFPISIIIKVAGDNGVKLNWRMDNKIKISMIELLQSMGFSAGGHHGAGGGGVSGMTIDEVKIELIARLRKHFGK